MTNTISKKDSLHIALLVGVALYYVYFIVTTVGNYQALLETGSTAGNIFAVTSSLTVLMMPVIHFLLLKGRKWGWMLCTIQMIMSVLGKLFALATIGWAGFSVAASAVLVLQVLLLFLLFLSRNVTAYNISSNLKVRTAAGALGIKILLAVLIWASAYI